MAGMMNKQDRVNALPLHIREQIAHQLDRVNSFPGLTDRERQRERELVSSWVSYILRQYDAPTIEGNDKNNGDDFRHVAYGIYEENGEIKSGVIPDHIVKADQERNAQASRDYYAKAIERANQYTEQLKAQRLERNEVI